MDRQEIVASETEYEHLLAQIRRLQAQIAELTALRDDLVYHVCPALQAEYEEKIGSLERQLLAAQMYLREKQRMIELLQAQINRKKKPSFDEAQKEAHEEYKAYEEELKRKAKQAQEKRRQWNEENRWSSHDRAEKEAGEKSGQKAGQAGNSEGSGKASGSEGSRQRTDSRPEENAGASRRARISENVSGENAQETAGQNPDNHQEKETPVQRLRRLYRQIVKRLHPDVNPNLTEHEKELFNAAAAAYSRGDLEEIERIWDELSGMDEPQEKYEDTPEGREKLQEMLTKLKERYESLQRQISGIKADFPYKMKTFLEDAQAVERKQGELRSRIDQTREKDRKLAEYIEQLKKQL